MCSFLTAVCRTLFTSTCGTTAVILLVVPDKVTHLRQVSCEITCYSLSWDFFTFFVKLFLLSIFAFYHYWATILLINIYKMGRKCILILAKASTWQSQACSGVGLTGVGGLLVSTLKFALPFIGSPIIHHYGAALSPIVSLQSGGLCLCTSGSFL